MKRSTQTFEIEIDNADILERAMNILDIDSNELKNFMERYENEIKEYAKMSLDMIDKEDATEFCIHEHVN